jgi:hypothetical protein
MKKALIVLAAVATIALGAINPTPAQARGGAVAAGIIGGFAAGAIVGSALAYPRYYAPVPGYVVYPGYAAPYPVACPGGYWAGRPRFDAYGNVIGYGRPRFVCP